MASVHHHGRPQKLRASCDNCGVSKLKCDRQHPECGRCVSVGMQCVYGVSQRVPKQQQQQQQKHHPRHNNHHHHQIPDDLAPRISDGTRPTANIATSGLADDVSGRGSSSAIVGDSDGTAGDVGGGDGGGVEERHVRSAHPSRQISQLDVNMEGAASRATEASQQQQQDYLWMCDPLWRDSTDTWPLQTPADPSVNDLFPDQTTRPHSPPLFPQLSTKQSIDMQDDGGTALHASSSLFPPAQHDCFLQAYDALGVLSAYPVQSAALAPSISPSASAHQLPIDEVLHRTRRANERLGEIVNCTCVQSPDLQLLCASILARVLSLYQHACSCLHDTATVNPPIRRMSATHSTISPYSAAASSREASSSGWQNTNTSPPSSASASAPSSALHQAAQDNALLAQPPPSHKITIGTFEVEDLDMQSLLSVQLLSGELRKFGLLINKYVSRDDFVDRTAHFHNHLLYDHHTTNLINKSLSSWLNSEYARISHFLRSRLRTM